MELTSKEEMAAFYLQVYRAYVMDPWRSREDRQFLIRNLSPEYLDRLLDVIPVTGEGSISRCLN